MNRPQYYNNHGYLCGSDTGEKAGNCCKSPGKDYNISRELSCYLKRQSIYQNNLYNTNDTADLGLYGPQWKAKKISFWMCTVSDGAQWTRVEGIVQLIPTMKSIGADKQENKASKSNEAEKCDQIATKEEKIDFSNVKIEPLFEEEVDFDTFSKSDFRAVKVKECVAAGTISAQAESRGRGSGGPGDHWRRTDGGTAGQ